MEQEPRPKGASVSSSSEPLGADEENVIRYMACYVPFKLLKAYEKIESEDAAAVVDCLRAMAQSGPDDLKIIQKNALKPFPGEACLKSTVLRLPSSADWMWQ